MSESDPVARFNKHARYSRVTIEKSGYYRVSICDHKTGETRTLFMLGGEPPPWDESAESMFERADPEDPAA